METQKSDREKYAEFCLVRYSKSRVSKKKLTERLLREFDIITRYPDVTSVTVVGSTITVRTKDIHTKRGTRLNLGLFDIKITKYPSKNKIRLQALRTSTYAHPHISGDGRACFGNVRSTVTKLARQYEFASLILLLLEYLKRPNY